MHTQPATESTKQIVLSDYVMKELRVTRDVKGGRVDLFPSVYYDRVTSEILRHLTMVITIMAANVVEPVEL